MQLFSSRLPSEEITKDLMKNINKDQPFSVSHLSYQVSKVT